ncbi:MAG: RNA methyltransferase [Nitrospirae bacterium]|nr:MAG: RNA methyltransferase [Nitrospirota bacterium]
MSTYRENIHFVLVEPRERGNIGASARAIKNMGFKNLILVNPPEDFAEEKKEDFWLACHATDLLKEAEVYKDLKEALRDKQLVVGTTRRTGKKRGLILPVKEAVKEIKKAAQTNKVAILFGREDRGLTNEEVLECGFLLYIPTSEEAPSLNLAQAVLLVAYELTQGEFPEPSPEFAPHQELEALYGHIRKVLKLLEYIPRGDRDMEERIMRNLKHLFGRTGITAWELRMLHGICSQIEKKLQR